jgi:hypothetical protein
MDAPSPMRANADPKEHDEPCVSLYYQQDVWEPLAKVVAWVVKCSPTSLMPSRYETWMDAPSPMRANDASKQPDEPCESLYYQQDVWEPLAKVVAWLVKCSTTSLMPSRYETWMHVPSPMRANDAPKQPNEPCVSL